MGHLIFNNSPASYTIAPGTGGTLTIDNSGTGSTGSPDITVLAGTHAISAPLILVNGVMVNTSAGTLLTVSGAITGTGPLTVAGAGTLKLSAANSFSGGTNVVSSTLEMAPTASIVTSTLLNVSGGTVLFDAGGGGILNRSIGALNISGGVVSIASAANHSNRTLLSINGLSITGTAGALAGKLDIGNNDLDIQATSLISATHYVMTGLNTGGTLWGGNGITSSAAAADTRHLTAVGVIQNNQSGSALYTAQHPFDGATPAAGDILVKYTYFGDANLDGKVDGSDYSLVDSGYLLHATGWYNGDFNYDGTINGSDYTLIDNAFNRQGTSLAAVIAASPTAQLSGSSQVPEPTALCILAVAGGILSRRRRA